jgi:hypothetical protein
MEQKVLVLDTNLVSPDFPECYRKDKELVLSEYLADFSKYELAITPFTFYELIRNKKNTIPQVCSSLLSRNISVLTYRDIQVDLSKQVDFVAFNREIQFILLDEIAKLFILIILSLFEKIPSFHFTEQQKPSFDDWQTNFRNEVFRNAGSPADFDCYCNTLFSRLLKGCEDFADSFCSEMVTLKDIKMVLFGRDFKVTGNSLIIIGSKESEYLLFANSLTARLKYTKNEPTFNRNDVVDRLNAHAAFQQTGWFFSTADKTLLKHLINEPFVTSKDEVEFLKRHYRPLTE